MRLEDVRVGTRIRVDDGPWAGSRGVIDGIEPNDENDGFVAIVRVRPHVSVCVDLEHVEADEPEPVEVQA